MKKISILIILFLLILPGCTSVQFEQEGFFKDSEYIKIVELYNNWKLEEAEKELLLLEKEKPDNMNIPRMRVLISEKKKLQEDLYFLVEKIKVSIKNNNIDELAKYTKKSFFNNKKLEELKKNDFSIFDIYSGNLKFKGEKAECMSVFNYGDETFYISMKFHLEKREWKIVDYFERR